MEPNPHGIEDIEIDGSRVERKELSTEAKLESEKSHESDSKSPFGIPQYKIIFIHSSGKYCKDYVGKQYFQDLFEKYNLPPKPFENKYGGCIVGLGLINKGIWYDENQEKLDFAWGPYLLSYLEILQLEKPMKYRGEQNNSYLTNDEWQKLCADNPSIVPQIKLWKTIYVDHLTRCTKYSDIPVRTFNMPWAVLDSLSMKSVENQKGFRNHKVDRNYEPKYVENIRCRQCLHKKSRCVSCQKEQDIIDSKKKT